ncbi:hypothetical protein QN277_000624 [Acacia crassicarpa]|nr:hypothetical protein QN277_000624 [Acacia crassicarpa]
MCYYFEH